MFEYHNIYRYIFFYIFFFIIIIIFSPKKKIESAGLTYPIAEWDIYLHRYSL